ncbi:Maf family protein [Paratractidigestivibacter sp.]|uniref:Maf family protein n=1 Tax=Paratractidigestivibacter sp. TaxID=2847316 RepID=UPI002ABE4952|nr:Maf family protein [Paratractidigestivibacter sp.]
MILASQSPRRRQLLEELGYTLAILPADIDEAPQPSETPVELVCRLAEQKAEASRLLATERGLVDADGLLVAADTIVWDDEGRVLGKPADEEDARRMLRALAGRIHHVSTGCCAVALGDGLAAKKRASFVETTDVEFWPLNDAQIDVYIASGEPMDKAGAYGIQGKGRVLVRGIRGDYFSVVGLPVSRLAREIEALLA